MTETGRRLKHILIIQSVVGCLFCFSPESPKRIFIGYVQLNSTTVLDFLAPGMHDTSYLNMQHLGAGYNFFRSDSSYRVFPAILYPRSIGIA